MYAEFYELKELPFALTPDPRFIYFTPSHTEVMANLHYGIESGKGLVVVTGEVGTGKTTILRWMMQRHPEIGGCRPGAARVYGQIACWHAAMKSGAESAMRTFRALSDPAGPPTAPVLNR